MSSQSNARWLWVSLALLLFGACSLPFTTSSTTPPAENMPTVLFQDDFHDDSGGWAVFDDPAGSVSYQGQALLIEVHEPSMFIWSLPGLDLDDVRIEVDATKADGPDDNLLGVICRYQDEEHFYLLAISSDGYYGIIKITPDGETLLTGDGESMSYHDAILQGEALNHIRAVCQGERLRLYANQVLLADVRDPDYSRGDVGLLAGTFDLPGTAVLFDNFLVLAP